MFIRNSSPGSFDGRSRRYISQCFRVARTSVDASQLPVVPDGAGISLIGTWMQQVAMAWLLYRITGSASLLGVFGFLSQVPSLFLSPFAGVFADRWNRHRAAHRNAVSRHAAGGAAAGHCHGGEIAGGPFMILGLFLGIVNAFDMPIRQSFVVEMVPHREHLSNAIALNSTIVNGARLVGPSLAGVIIAAWGERACFLLNALSYVAVLWALFAMRDLPRRDRYPEGHILRHLKDGFAYAFGFPPLRILLGMLAIISFCAMSVSVLMPVFAKDILHGDANTQGLLMGASGFGALMAALYLAARKSVLGLGRVIVISTACLGAGQILFSYSNRIWVSALVLIVTGCGMMLHMAASNTLIQTIVQEDKRGRVMSMYSMAFLGIAPLGSLLSGSLADLIGAPATVRISGGICLFVAACFALQLPQMRKLVRPIYEEAGILTREMPPGS
ncbi:MAG: MFS transporter [Planctomycetales bacterium]